MTLVSKGWRSAVALMALAIVDLVLAAIYVGASVMVASDDSNGQAIAVLWGDANEIGPETERRIAHAIDIWQAGGRAQFIFCVGGSRPARGYFGARVCAEQFASAGVPPDRIWIGPGSNDTASNLLELAEIAKSLAVRRIVLVANSLQAMRGKMLLATPAGLTFVWSPYDLRMARPPIGSVELWWRAHYEWLALASMLLPLDARRDIIGLFRS